MLLNSISSSLVNSSLSLSSVYLSSNLSCSWNVSTKLINSTLVGLICGCIYIVLIFLLIGLVIQEVEAIDLKNSITPINKIAIDFINSSFYKVNYATNGDTLAGSLNLFLEYKKITLSESEFQDIYSFAWSFYSQNHN